MGRFMVYGAYGYTGRLVAEHAVARGLEPLLAGRNEASLAPLAKRLGLPYVAVDLSDAEGLQLALQNVDAVLHCAGPFSATSAPMLEACAATGTHYLDITGEIEVFEAVHARSLRWKEAGIVALPGVGFDVVPTDCMAALLHEALPEADTLELAFMGLGGMSAGTMKTAVEGLPHGSAIRKDGVITPVPSAHRTRTVFLKGKERHAIAIPWGDVSTAFHSTGIPNITAFMVGPASMARGMRVAYAIRPMFRAKWLQRLLKAWVGRTVKGPDKTTRTQGASYVWGRATSPDGRWAEGRLKVAEGYHVTALAGGEATLRVMDGQVAPGAHTPSSAFGPRFVEGFEGSAVDPIEMG